MEDYNPVIYERLVRCPRWQRPPSKIISELLVSLRASGDVDVLVDMVAVLADKWDRAVDFRVDETKSLTEECSKLAGKLEKEKEMVEKVKRKLGRARARVAMAQEEKLALEAQSPALEGWSSGRWGGGPWRWSSMELVSVTLKKWTATAEPDRLISKKLHKLLKNETLAESTKIMQYTWVDRFERFQTNGLKVKPPLLRVAEIAILVSSCGIRVQRREAPEIAVRCRSTPTLADGSSTSPQPTKFLL
ncbi:hypothetical protein AJ80_06384 [Polytolypa hystricis UAMH7299]|uniref:Uncharacterized protein n=1 Tax=Polytolypa hystricis (strain UAMH7299) TaxID=1447883 RepID=A0A2B7XNC4_POLH7|nr:hypothetical protein AJ80_06384 [Polytolypa hystricis UAMH7299]